MVLLSMAYFIQHCANSLNLKTRQIIVKSNILNFFPTKKKLTIKIFPLKIVISKVNKEEKVLRQIHLNLAKY